MTVPGAPRTVRVRLHGRVQGVGYRDWTIRTAAPLGLSGWVRNRMDGTVEALLHGAPDAVAQMLAACRTGPRGARVTTVDVEDAPGEPVNDGFLFRPTV